MLRIGLSVFLVIATIAYPLGVYYSIGKLPPQWLAVAMLLLALARACIARQKFWWLTAAGAALLCGASWWGAGVWALKLYPVLVNVVLCAVFVFSLWSPPTVVERLARLQEPDLPPSGVRYTRQVTQVWCVFFMVNGTAAAYTALFSDDKVWALYNGAIAYVLMGCLMAGEWLVRQRVRKNNKVGAQK